jgi:hypothetical protein
LIAVSSNANSCEISLTFGRRNGKIPNAYETAGKGQIANFAVTSEVKFARHRYKGVFLHPTSTKESSVRSQASLGIIALIVAIVPASTATAAFVAGNLVIYRVGDGSADLLNTGAKVFLDEYTPAGVLVQSVEMPSTGTVKLIADGVGETEGWLTRSPDGTQLALTGYNSTIPAGASLSTTSATIERTVAIVDASASATLYSFSDLANVPRSAVIDGTKLYITGNTDGIRYRDASTLVANSTGNTSTQLSTSPTNFRQTNIFDGQLYVSTAAGTTVRIGTVGTGEPTTSGQTISTLPGIPAPGSGAGSEPFAFFFADLSAGVTGLDTLYVAFNDANGLAKFSLVGGSWVASGQVGVAADNYRGLTGSVSGSTVTLYATRNGGSGANGGGDFVSLVDSSGYSGTLSGTPTVLATLGTTSDKAFRGIAFAPVPEPGAVLFGGLVCGAFVSIAAWRRFVGKSGDCNPASPGE